MIIYIYGEDTFRSRQYLKKTIDQFKKQRDPQGYNVVILDAKKEESERILSELVSVPFLAEKRMVVLENILSTGDKGLLEELAVRIRDKSIPESNIVVFWQGEIFAKGKTSKGGIEAKDLAEALAKEKYVQEFKKLEADELMAWANKEVVSQNGKINHYALNYLVKNVNGDMWLLNSLLEQFLSYRKAEEIGINDVQLFLEEKADDNIFNMVDAVVSGNKKLAFKLLEDQRGLGEDDMYLFSMILRQFKILLQMRDLLEREGEITSDRLAKDLDIHPFVAKKSLPLVRKYSLTKLKTIYEELLQIDVKTKTGQGDQSVMLDLFVGKI